MKLDLFANWGADENKLHPKFKLLRDSLMTSGEKAILESWTDNFIDRDNKIVLEFQTTFHSAFWEFYLYRVFIEAGFAVDFSHDRPDFIITSPYEIYVEAVVAEIKKDGATEAERDLNDILSMSDPPHLQNDFKELIDEAIVRHSNSLLSKSKKYVDNYSRLRWVKESCPFIVAMSSYDQINYGREFYYSMLALLFGRYYNPAKRTLESVTAIKKPNTNSEIPVGLFNDSEYSHISAIIFSCTLTLGKLTALFNSITNPEEQFQKVVTIRHDPNELLSFKPYTISKDLPEELSDGVFIFHNQNAKVKLPDDFLANTNVTHIHANDSGFSATGEQLPIVARLNLPKHLFLDQFIQEIYTRYNS